MKGKVLNQLFEVRYGTIPTSKYETRKENYATEDNTFVGSWNTFVNAWPNLSKTLSTNENPKLMGLLFKYEKEPVVIDMLLKKTVNMWIWDMLITLYDIEDRDTVEQGIKVLIDLYSRTMGQQVSDESGLLAALGMRSDSIDELMKMESATKVRQEHLVAEMERSNRLFEREFERLTESE